MSANAPKLVADQRDELDEYTDLIEAMSLDPDGFQPTERSRSLLAKYAASGCAVGTRHDNMRMISVDRDFLLRFAENGAVISLKSLGALTVAA